MSSSEFAEWMAFYILEAEAAERASGDHEPDADELAVKLAMFADVANARARAEQNRAR